MTWGEFGNRRLAVQLDTISPLTEIWPVARGTNIIRWSTLAQPKSVSLTLGANSLLVPFDRANSGSTISFHGLIEGHQNSHLIRQYSLQKILSTLTSIYGQS